MATDSQQEDTESRTREMTEKGESFYRQNKESFLKHVQSSEHMLIQTIDNLKELPNSLAALESAENDVYNVFKRFDKSANEYMDFLDRSSHSEAKSELEKFWITVANLKKQYQLMMDKIQLKKESSELRSVRSHNSLRSRSHKSYASDHEMHAVSQRAKAESEKIKLQFVKKEAAIKIEQFEKKIQLEILEQQKNAAAADAEASVLEKHSQHSQVDPLESKDNFLLKEELSPFEKTLNYLGSLETAQQEKPLSVHAKPFIPMDEPNTTLMDTQVTSSTPIVNRTYTLSAMPIVTNCETQGDFKSQPLHDQFVTTKNTDQHEFISRTNQQSDYFIKKNLLFESLQQQKFDDKPERFIVWKKQFCSIISDIRCSPFEQITLLTNCVKRDSSAYQLIMSARASCAGDPDVCLVKIWERLDQRFGSPELIESALKSKLSSLPQYIDHKALYDLHDLLNETQAVKDIKEYSVIFSYLDSSIGIRPIIQKLPKFIQDKWVTRVVKFKHETGAVFPPFSELVKFIGEISVIRNDPCLVYDSPSTVNIIRKQNKQSIQGKQLGAVKVHKTDVNSNIVTKDLKSICVIHKGSKHSLNECKAYRAKGIEERKNIIRSHNLCFRCCETSDHFAKNCSAKVQCNICKATSHCTAFHKENDLTENQTSFKSNVKHGEEVTCISKCTEICGTQSFTGKSCARIVPVRIFQEGQYHKSTLAYAMLDDQSNKTLGSTDLFDNMNISTPPIQYTIDSCSGRSKSSGRVVNNLVVESVTDNLRLKLPPVLECNYLPNNQAEVPTPDIARHYSHMTDIADHLLEYNMNMKVVLLIGRDTPEAHHVFEQRLGPPGSPFAQRSTLGWTIIGEVCLFGKHRPSSSESNQTFTNGNGRPSGLKTCEQVINVRKTFIDSFKPQPVKADIFEITSDDNKPGLSIEDRKFLDIMNCEFRLSDEGKWIAPLPIRTPRDPMPDNYQLALNRAKALDASLHKNETKKKHFLEFMQKIFDNHHVEIAPYLPPETERWYLPLFGIYHPRKPDQIRGVFDSSSRYNDVSLNEQLLQGPDLINSLLGILIRFRKEMVGVVADIQQMFHSFLVDEKHRDYLRFLWHIDNVLENPLVTYRIRVHVFGNRPSPSIAMYGLRRIGELAGENHGNDVKQFIINDFYVDDGLKSCTTDQNAIDLITKTQQAMKMHGNLRLHKFASNSKTVMDAFQTDDLAKGIIDMDFEKDNPYST